MAQSGFTPILLYSSSTVSQAPSAGNLTNSTLGSELAINITDGKLFYKDNANNVQVIGWKTVPTTAGGTGLTSYTAGDLLYYATGTALSQLAIGTANTVLTSSGTAPQWSTSITLSGNATAAAFIPSGATVPTNGMYLSAANTLAWATNTTFAATLTSAGNFGVGYSVADAKLESSTTTDNNLQITRYAASTSGSVFRLRHSYDGTIGTNTLLPGTGGGYEIGRLDFQGALGGVNGYGTGVRILARALGTTSSTAMPGQLEFYTTPASSVTPTLRQTITPTGEVLFGGTTSVDAKSGALALESTTGGDLNLIRNDTTVTSGEALGEVAFWGNDTTSNTRTKLAYIQSAASGDHAAGDNPTDLVFATTPDGTSTVTEYARFTADKYLRFPSGFLGIQFNGNTAADDSLDDYEEGTFTPTITNLTLGNGTIAGRFLKVGKMVYMQVNLTWGSTTSSSGNNDFDSASFPFAVRSTTYVFGTVWLFDSGTTQRQAVAMTNSSSTSVYIGYGTGNGETRINATSPWTWANGDRVNMAFMYNAD